MTQRVLGGVLGYAPLLGIPSPADLHREDAALHRLLHAGLGLPLVSYHGTAALLPQPYTSLQATAYTSTCRPTASLAAYWIT